MGKTKQEKKFNRNVEISAPYLDPEIIKQIHSPPRDQKQDIRYGGFKALLADPNSQDSADEMTPITSENHIPSYIGISCAVSGYSNYSPHSRGRLNTNDDKLKTSSSKLSTANRSQTNSPLYRGEQQIIHHVTIDKSTISSPDQERKELTEKLTASVAERRRSPSPLPPIEDDRHHGAYVGARYFPMPEPSKQVHKHIPLLGIDDDIDPDQIVIEDVNKVEKKIASLYGDDFVEDWKESMSHKSKKELPEEATKSAESSKPVNLKDIVSLKPTPPKASPQPEELIQVDIPAPNVKVLAGVEKEFLNRLLTDNNPPMPKSPSPQPSPLASPTSTKSIPNSVEQPQPQPQSQPQQQQLNSEYHMDEPNYPTISPEPPTQQANLIEIDDSTQAELEDAANKEIEAVANQEFHRSRLSSGDSKEEVMTPESQVSSSTVERAPLDKQDNQVFDEDHIEYEIRAESPQVNNESSPIKVLGNLDSASALISIEEKPNLEAENLVNFSPEPDVESTPETNNNLQGELIQIEDFPKSSIEDRIDGDAENVVEIKTDFEEPNSTDTPVELEQVVDSSEESRDGHYFLDLLSKEEGFIMERVRLAEQLLAERGEELDEERLGRIHSAIGKANLLINKKCNQFKELCEKSIHGDANDQYKVLNDDLAGFWDMISIQIADVQKSLENP